MDCLHAPSSSRTLGVLTNGVIIMFSGAWRIGIGLILSPTGTAVSIPPGRACVFEMFRKTAFTNGFSLLRTLN